MCANFPLSICFSIRIGNRKALPLMLVCFFICSEYISVLVNWNDKNELFVVKIEEIPNNYSLIIQSTIIEKNKDDRRKWIHCYCQLNQWISLVFLLLFFFSLYHLVFIITSHRCRRRIEDKIIKMISSLLIQSYFDARLSSKSDLRKKERCSVSLDSPKIVLKKNRKSTCICVFFFAHCVSIFLRFIFKRSTFRLCMKICSIFFLLL